MKLQLTLSNMLLLTTIVALSVLLWMQTSRNKEYENRLPGLRDAARELVVTDPERLHAVESHPEWHDEQTWNIHVPASGTYQLKLLTKDIPNAISRYPVNANDFPAPEVSLKLAAGTHKVELLQRKRDVVEIEGSC